MPPIPGKKHAAKKASVKKAHPKKPVEVIPDDDELKEPWYRSTIEAKLCRMANTINIHPKELMSYKHHMNQYGIDPESVDVAHVRKANELDRKWAENLKTRVTALGMIWR